MELRDALVQIAEIRRQMAKSDVFRGYRSAPVASSGLLALLAAAVQPVVAADPSIDVHAYVGLWVSVAVLTVMGVAAEMAVRTVWTQDRAHLEPTWLAVEQFLPSLVAGVLVTVVLVRQAPHLVVLLPGLWQVIYSLGIFASARLLPKPVFAVAAFYLMSGAVVLVGAGDGWSLAPWAMGVPFAVGQFAAAAILYWTLERRR